MPPWCCGVADALSLAREAALDRLLAAAAAAAALDSVSACSARKSSRWLANVFCDCRILRTLAVCFPCAVFYTSALLS